MIIMLLCNVCGHANPENSRFCNKCGEKIIFREYVPIINEENKTTTKNTNDTKEWNKQGVAFARIGRYAEAIDFFNK